MTVVLNGSGLTIEKLARVARHGEQVELAPEALARIGVCRAMLEEKIQAHEIMYGVNTGIGEFSEIVLNDDQVKDFQKYLIYNHSAGIGDPAPAEYVRGAMVGRINVHAHGNSGCRPVITQTLVAMLNRGVAASPCWASQAEYEVRSDGVGPVIPGTTARAPSRSNPVAITVIFTRPSSRGSITAPKMMFASSCAAS